MRNPSQKTFLRRAIILALLLPCLLLLSCGAWADFILNALYVDVQADPSIGSFDETDQFEITYQSKDTGETDILTVNAAAAAEGCTYELPVGSYTVTKIQYQGQKEQVEAGGYAVARSFRITESWDSLELITIYVGEDTLNGLDSYTARRLVRDEAHGGAADTPEETQAAETEPDPEAEAEAELQAAQRAELEAMGIDPDAPDALEQLQAARAQDPEPDPTAPEAEEPPAGHAGTAVAIVTAVVAAAALCTALVTRKKKKSEGQ